MKKSEKMVLTFRRLFIFGIRLTWDKPKLEWLNTLCHRVADGIWRKWPPEI